LGAVTGLAAFPVLARAQDQAQYIPVPVGITGDGKVMMRVWINGAGPFVFLMDTGSSASGIQSALAGKLGLKSTRGQAVDGVGGREIESVYLAAEARFGPYLHQHGVAFDAMPRFRESAAGLIAAGFLTRRPSVLDYGASEIRIYTSSGPDLRDFTPVKSSFFTPDPRASQMIVVSVILDGVPLRLLVDTAAAAHVLLYPSVVRTYHLWDRYGPGTPNRSIGVTGAVDATRMVTMPDFAMSDVTVPSLPVTLMDPAAHNENDGIDGLLGARFLKSFAIAFTRKGIAFRPVAQPFRP
jgi:hypothetical protein